MAKIAQLAADSFKNFIANLNTGRDKQAGGEYSLLTLSDQQLSTIYRTSWMARKVVDIPAQDATRKWREWNADEEQIELLEQEEKRLLLPQKVKLALQQARLFGGAGLYFSIKGDDPATPLDVEAVQEGQLEFIVVLSRDVLTPGDMDLDPLSENYGKPTWYEVSSSAQMQRIHPSRVAAFTGNQILTPQELTGHYQGWGDSVLQAAYEAVRNADSIATNIASLVYEAKIDVLQIPDLANVMANPKHRELLEQRVVLSAALKGNNGMLVMDAAELYSQKQFSFGGLTEINIQSLQAVAGAADIPMTRFLGQSPGGLNATGDSDLKNYYDAVASMQTLEVTPALKNLDEALIRSALGDRPEDVWYGWASLWQMSDDQKASISGQTASMIKTLADCGLFPEVELAEAAANLLVEHSILPDFNITTADLEEKAEEEAASAQAELDVKMAKAAGGAVKDEWDPNQPRDDRGRWAETDRGGQWRDAAKERLKTLQKKAEPYANKGELTSGERDKFVEITKEMADIRFDLMTPASEADVTADVTLNALPKSTTVAAWEAVRSNRDVHAAITEAAMGVSFNANTAVDDIMEGKNGRISAEKFYDTFHATRESLRSAVGDTITLYRAESGKQKHKATTNWATTRLFAEQFGSNIISKEVSVDDIVAIHTTKKGLYHEVIVRTGDR